MSSIDRDIRAYNEPDEQGRPTSVVSQHVRRPSAPPVRPQDEVTSIQSVALGRWRRVFSSGLRAEGISDALEG